MTIKDFLSYENSVIILSTTCIGLYTITNISKKILNKYKINKDFKTKTKATLKIQNKPTITKTISDKNYEVFKNHISYKFPTISYEILDYNLEKQKQKPTLIREMIEMNYNYKDFEGFTQKNNENIGQALTYGYKSLIEQHVFKKEEKNYFKDITRKLEFIIGINLMQQLFFSCDLKTLIQELDKYQNIFNTTEIIRLLDYIYITQQKKEISKQEANLIEICKEKINYYINELKITKLLTSDIKKTSKKSEKIHRFFKNPNTIDTLEDFDSFIK